MGTCQTSPVKFELTVEIKRTFHSWPAPWDGRETHRKGTRGYRQGEGHVPRVRNQHRAVAGMRGSGPLGTPGRGTKTLVLCHSCHISPSLQVRRAQDGLHPGSLWTQGKRRCGKACDVSVIAVGLWPGARRLAEPGCDFSGSSRGLRLL